MNFVFKNCSDRLSFLMHEVRQAERNKYHNSSSTVKSETVDHAVEKKRIMVIDAKIVRGKNRGKLRIIPKHI